MQNNLSNFDIFSSFAPRYDSNKNFKLLWNSFKNINFKILATNEMYRLILNQEQVISQKYSQDLHKTFNSSYYEEAKQIAYLDAFLSAVYSLTENIAKVTKIFYPNLPHGFNRQRNTFLKKVEINHELNNILKNLEWYDLFREVRVESSHFGNAFLIWEGAVLDPGKARSFLMIQVGSAKNNKVVKSNTFFFDFHNVHKIKSGINDFIELWSSVLIKQLDPNTTTEASILDEKGEYESSKTITLNDVLEKKVKIEIQNKLV